MRGKITPGEFVRRKYLDHRLEKKKEANDDIFQ